MPRETERTSSIFANTKPCYPALTTASLRSGRSDPASSSWTLFLGASHFAWRNVSLGMSAWLRSVNTDPDLLSENGALCYERPQIWCTRLPRAFELAAFARFGHCNSCCNAQSLSGQASKFAASRGIAANDRPAARVPSDRHVEVKKMEPRGVEPLCRSR